MNTRNYSRLILLLLCCVLLLSSCSKKADTAENSRTADESVQAETALTEETTPQTEALTEPSVPLYDDYYTPGTYRSEEYSVLFDGVQSNPNDVYDATGFVSITDVIPDAMLDIRYYSTYNFIGDRIDGYEAPVALLSKEAAQALLNASNEFKEMGYRIKIFDAYRPQNAVEHFVSWAQDLSDTRMQDYFYPELDKSVLFKYGYIARYSGHSRGATVDMTLFDMKTGQDVDMGCTFDYFGDIAHPDYTNITGEQYQNRMILQNVMVKNGFKTCSTEWWDFTFVSEPYPNTYFTFPVSLESLIQ